MRKKKSDLIIWNAFEHRIKNRLEQNLNITNWKTHEKFLLCVSGGVDSMAMLAWFVRLRAWHQSAFSVLHLHHGKSANLAQTRFREQCQSLVQNYCDQHQVSILIGHWEGKPLQSEQQFRDFRRAQVSKILAAGGFTRAVTAHHAQDLLETRLLRLVRGTGPQGLRAMRTWGKTHFRPFLQESKAELLQYAADLKVNFLEDPSNAQLNYQRNWLRHEWLPALEAHSKGAVQAMARSLENLAHVADRTQWVSGLWVKEGISRPVYLSLSALEQMRALAALLLRVGIYDFRQSQLQEICKRLDKAQNEHMFTAVGLVWSVAKLHIRVAPVKN